MKGLFVVVVLALASCISAGIVPEISQAQTPDKTLPKAGTPTWMWAQNGELPCADAVIGGNDWNVDAIFYLGRILYQDNLLPGKVETKQNLTKYHAFANYDMSLVAMSNTYEVLCGEGLAWQPLYNTTVLPSNFLPAGFLANGVALPACRTFSSHTDDVGYVHPQMDNRCLFADNDEIYGSLPTYEILIQL